jgi:hypothetical protein
MNSNKRFPLLLQTTAVVLATALIGPACRGSSKPTLAVTGASGDPVLAFANEEIAAFLGPDYAMTPTGRKTKAAWTLDLVVDEAMAPFSFAVRRASGGPSGGSRIELRGRDAAGVLHALYTMLAEAGVVFDVTGPLRPPRVDLARVKDAPQLIRPAVERRGIRQHINFAMDISSYPLEEAKAYIRNLARLRMNYITFHSYPGQWIPDTTGGGPALAGRFFYGQHHTLPRDPALRKVIRNAAEFCIPEIEPFFDRPAEKSRMAMDWLRAVMAEAKRAGLTVNFSMELREADPARSLAACETAIAAYPMIDGFEIITQEDGEKPAAEISYNAKVAEKLREARTGTKNLDYGLGLYNTTPADVKTAFEVMRRVAPSGMHLAVLPAHGARMVVRNLDGIPLASDDRARTMLYSWVEFDGLMYLQQNPVEGIRRLLDDQQARANGAPLYGVCWNHWRTAENRTAIAYAARAMIEGPLPPADFYRDYAAGLGLGNVGAYAAAMQRLDDADDDARTNLFNIGFCYGGYWALKRGIANYGRYAPEKIEASIARFEAVREGLRPSIHATPPGAGRRYLEFLDNRVACTVLHLRSFLPMAGLRALFSGSSPPALTDADRRRIRAACDEALGLQARYLALHARIIEDRGCEGTLVSYGDAPPVLLKKIRETYTGAGAPEGQKPADAPPAPKK